jgi:hypothetical protein
MRTLFARTSLLVMLTGVFACASASVAAADFGVSKWEAGTCKVSTCTDEGPHSDFYTQAAGHPDFGITLFEFNTKEVAPLGALEPEGGGVKNIRVDLPPGLAVNPEATVQCTEAQLNESKCPEGSQVGIDEARGTISLNETLIAILEAEEILPPGIPVGTKLTAPTPEVFPVYNMVRKPGEAARFGILIESLTLDLLGIREISYMEGGISWFHEAPASDEENSELTTGDYHEYFKIRETPTSPELVSSKLIFWGVPQEHQEHPSESPKAFLTLPSTCNGPQITTLHVNSYEDPGTYLVYKNATPVGAEGCNSLEFSPSFALTPETTQQDTPDGVETVLHVPQYTEEPSRPNSPTLESASVTLPEGLSLNAPGAHGLEACTNAQFGMGTNAPIACPSGSVVGTATIEAPGVPNGSLKGNLYLGSQESTEPESGKEFRILLAAEAPEYGVGVRLEGQVKANTQTGQLTASFTGNPQIPFENLKLKFTAGATSPLANPLECGPASASGTLISYSGPTAAFTSSPFTVDSDGKGGACPATLPFTPTQSTKIQPDTAGAYSSYTLQLARTDGQQYIGHVQVTLPPGLLAAIPSITLCTEAQASAGACTSASEIGTVIASVGAGPTPYNFTGHVYLTGPYNGAPYGLLLSVPVVAGPLNLGTDNIRMAINVDPHTARLIVSGDVPKVFGGVPVRLKTVTMQVTRGGYLFNPTNCDVLATESVLTGYTPGTNATVTASVSTPFQATGCTGLAFKPTFAATTAAKPTKANGASLNVKITQPEHQANIESVVTQLPKQLPSRLTTLQQACTSATFEGNPANCPAGSQVGTATVSTPVLPDKLTGTAYFVSHGNEAFPDLDLVLQGDNVTIILVGNTNISKAGITTSTFAALPDVPIKSVELNLPTGAHSALTSSGGFCSAKNLTMPTTITAQNNAVFKQNTKIAVTGCPIKILWHKPKGKAAALKVKAPEAGRVSASGKYLKTRYVQASKAGNLKFKVKLSKHGKARLRKDHKLKVRVRVGFVPKAKGQKSSTAHAIVSFKS